MQTAIYELTNTELRSEEAMEGVASPDRWLMYPGIGIKETDPLSTPLWSIQSRQDPTQQGPTQMLTPPNKVLLIHVVSWL